MAQVDFRVASVREHGLPQACVTCGNDENHQLISQHLVGKKPYGCGCFLLLFGPIGWVLAAIMGYVYSRKKVNMFLPVCKLCRQASKQLSYRVGGMLVLAGLLFSVDLKEALPMPGVGVAVSLLIAFYALIEYYWLSRQFSLRVVKASEAGVIVEVHNEDYPSLYQRHLDNALLYGSSDSLGTRSEDA